MKGIKSVSAKKKVGIEMPQYHSFDVSLLTAWENHVASNNIGGGICERRRRRAGITLP